MPRSPYDIFPIGLWRLRSVILNRFKAAFKPQPIRLHPFTVVIGRNGSGKSTLVEALQWIDATMRLDAVAACGRYHGVHDLINYRSQARPRYFKVGFEWINEENDDPDIPRELTGSWHYAVKVSENRRSGQPEISEENLYRRQGARRRDLTLISTKQNRVRLVGLPRGRLQTTFDEPERLALSRASRSHRGLSRGDLTLEVLRDFWNRAVFLRLSPNRLASNSPPRRKSFDPLLDEEGHMLPALLSELDQEERRSLVASVREIMQDITRVEVVSTGAREEQAYFQLHERMPNRGRAGESEFPIPSWMLSEGTRRITAIFGLLEHNPPPSLLCIEEIENGLDPWTVLAVLRRLQSAAESGTQVLITTHSTWLLDHVPLQSILRVRRSKGETVYDTFADERAIKRFASSVPPGTRFVNTSGGSDGT